MSDITALTVTEIAFTGYPVTDMARARAFYEQVLNLKTSMVYEQGDKAWIEYDIGPATLGVTNMAEQWKPSTQGPAVALEVADFEAAVAALKAAGTTFSVEPVDNGPCQLAVVLDPDGNSVAIHKRKPQQG